MKFNEAAQHLKQESKRAFTQTYDLIITLQNIDPKKPEHRFSKDVVLPHGRNKDVAVGIISDSVPGAISKSDLDQMDKKAIKKLTKEYEFFLCEAPLMVHVGKVLGKYLGPRGKMPRLLPPQQDPSKIVAELKNSVRVRVRDSPSIHIPVGTENMEPLQVSENAERVLDEVKRTLPKGATQIKAVLLKTTMSKPVKIDGW